MTKRSIASRLEAGFGQRGWLNAVFFPLSLLYGGVVLVRRWLYHSGPWRSIPHPGVPVIVIGNIYVGGTGKTPLIISLANRLKAQGFKPGVISRGYCPKQSQRTNNKKPTESKIISHDDSASEVGDEPLLILQETDLLVAIGPNRRDSAALLIKQGCDILLSDDGLQHYALKRDIEIAVIDAQRGHGNGWLLPAGPLREPVRRLKTVDWVVYHGGNLPDSSFKLAPSRSVLLNEQKTERKLEAWRGKTVHAVAGIGHPERFFDLLKSYGVVVIPHSFPDHHAYAQHELEFKDNFSLMMTAKDAVKCQQFELADAWVINVALEADESFFSQFDQLVAQCNIGPRNKAEPTRMVS